MWIFELLHDLYVIEFYIEKLVDGFESSTDGDVIFQLDGNFVIDQRLEEAVERQISKHFLYVTCDVAQRPNRGSYVPKEQHRCITRQIAEANGTNWGARSDIGLWIALMYRCGSFAPLPST